jgi:predicted nucleic acid-binding Zn ribbon protein
MSYREDQFEEDENAGLDERDDPDDSDTDDDDNAPTISCPYCQKEISEQAEVCPHCRNFISFEDAPRRYPPWLIAGVVVCILIVLAWMVTNA